LNHRRNGQDDGDAAL
jgi:hypothetical protein